MAAKSDPYNKKGWAKSVKFVALIWNLNVESVSRRTDVHLASGFKISNVFAKIHKRHGTMTHEVYVSDINSASDNNVTVEAPALRIISWNIVPA